MVSVRSEASDALQTRSPGSRPTKAEKPEEKIKTGGERCNHRNNSIEFQASLRGDAARLQEKF
jgi:hypothetical protein